MDGWGESVGGKKGPMDSVLGVLANANRRDTHTGLTNATHIKRKVQSIIHYRKSILLGSLAPSVLTIETHAWQNG